VLKEVMLQHRVALVTGGAGGTGLEISRSLTELGIHVVVWGRTEERLRAVVNAGHAKEFAVVNLGDAAAVERATTSLQRSGSIPTLVIHTAGVWTAGNLWEVPTDDLRAHLSSVVDGSVYVARAALLLFADGPGHFVQVAAASAKPGYPDTALNTLAKRAQDGLQEGLSHELRASDVRVTTIYPDSIAAAGSELVTSGYAMSYRDVADAVLYALQASLTVDVDEIVLTARRTGRWGT
jgi:NADP-dependent 3-hydroxy acid dehydrogenase YdfG